MGQMSRDSVDLKALLKVAWREATNCHPVAARLAKPRNGTRRADTRQDLECAGTPGRRSVGRSPERRRPRKRQQSTVNRLKSEAPGGHEAHMTTGSTRGHERSTEEPGAISLLWPREQPRPSPNTQQLPADSADDLQLTEIVTHLTAHDGRPSRYQHRERLVRQTLTELCTDPGVIAYRQETVDDLLRDVPLREHLAQILPDLEALAETAPSSRFQVADDGAVQRIARRLGDLELFVDVARQLERVLGAAPLRAAALTALRDYLCAMTGAPTFLALEAELPALRTTLSQARSVIVGINLTPDLVPDSATILSVSEDRVEGSRTLLGRLLGGLDVERGITPLQRTGGGFGGQPNRLTRDLNELLESVAAPVGRALDRYAAVPTEALAGIGPELALLLGGALLVERLSRAGLPMCRPEILAAADRVTELQDGYDVSLALRLCRPQDGTAGQTGPCNPAG